MTADKVPRIVDVVSALPRSGTGKILWRTLQESAMTAGPQAPTMATSGWGTAT